jgi:4,5-DOPA dioxygenase extradiol
MAARLLAMAGFKVTVDDQRGLDHGAWVPLWHLLPGADVPVFQVSMPRSLDAAGALRLGQVLAPLREQGVLIVGSGSMTHNLTEIRSPGSPEEAYAGEFAAWVRVAVMANATDQLVNYRRLAPHAVRAHPTEEHFLPLLVAFGALAEAEPMQIIDREITYGVLSMESYVWGMAADVLTSNAA